MKLKVVCALRAQETRFEFALCAQRAQATKTQKALELMRSIFGLWQFHFDKTAVFAVGR
jgi:hypothetical protein